MRGSLRLIHIRGVPVEVHWLFALLLAWVALGGWSGAHGWVQVLLAPGDLLRDPEQLRAVAAAVYDSLRGSLLAAGMLVVVFACVLVHEVGHTVHAQTLGIPVRRIVLLPIGGLAELARIPERPADELRVALAGPAANVGLALVFGALASVWVLAGGLPAPEVVRAALRDEAPALLGLLLYLSFANLALALFNLVPAFPMDGGRILRSFMALAVGRLTATRLVSGLSWLVGGVLTLAGLGAAQRWGVPASLGLVLVGLFTFAGAGFEKAVEENRLALGRLPARLAARQPMLTLSPLDRVTPAVAALLASLNGQSALPVVVGDRLVGLLTRRDVDQALTRGERYTVAHLMRTRFPYVRADEDLWRAQQLLSGAEAGMLPVLEGEALHGILTAADIRAARFAAPSPASAEATTLISRGNPIP
jgi:Zn-dependent protease